jgi:hypothetical protein
MRKAWGIFLCFLLITVTGAYAFRGTIRDGWETWNAPRLPSPTKLKPTVATSSLSPGGDVSPVEMGSASSEHFVMVTEPPKPVQKEIDPLAKNGVLPEEMNLDVPFTSQAPYQNWDMPYQEACEEASLIMVDGFYHDLSGRIPPADAKKQIDALVAFENSVLGYYKDTTAVETAEIAEKYFKYKDTRVLPVTSAEDIKRAVANGYPVILPASGKALNNPNFRNGGPPFHMLVVRGYTKDRFITNDPGTRKGENYTYSYEVLLNAIHDWNDGNVTAGKSVMLIIIPNS